LLRMSLSCRIVVRSPRTVKGGVKWIAAIEGNRRSPIAIMYAPVQVLCGLCFGGRAYCHPVLAQHERRGFPIPNPSPANRPTPRRTAGLSRSHRLHHLRLGPWLIRSAEGTDPPRKKQRRRVSCETRRRHGISISSSPLTQPRGSRPARGRPLCYFFSASRNTFTPAPFSASSWAPFAASLSGLPIRYSRRNGANRLSPAASF
jgi:hypothetical protein